MTALQLFFLRHGETDWNAEGRLQGQQDIPLNALGRRQAAQAGRKLKKIFGAGGVPAVWQASPLTRTRDTMTLARAELGLPAAGVRLDDRLKEFTFGRWEGKTWPDVMALDPEGAAARDRDKWNFCPPGGESYAHLAERLRPWLAEQQPPTVVVSHGGVARALMHLIGGLPIERAPTADIWQGRVLVFSTGKFEWV
ncbi:putative phosphoglycerate mutase [Rhodoblastus acidophilus]|uniref:histidine phosphatase family protein n=1 Tax=Rhodoblastus acidophilus TaxID=1074 RepID=UPI0022258AAC|nr:histidine phosphatase family protein [Rhodoblastus acidophilus]MCW2285633.1 putative phosphoglycerate mutase [Rhodoblastus acidophilus]MCW2334609.1 putative phosphoglycerate mutase [Rhodoblastus acidophilus]